MNKAGLISIIIPTYNRAHLINETLDSILTQTYGDWECIIVDDGSTDDTETVVSDYIQANPNQIFKYMPIANAGSSNARNLGIMQAKGIYLQFLDADDLWFEDFIENSIDTIKQTNVFFVFSS